MNNAKLERLRLIDFLLEHFGSFRRNMLMDYFGLSMPQVSLDIQAYLELAPANMSYDKSARMYKRSNEFSRVLP